MDDLDQIKREIKDKISIEGLIGRYIRVERSGRNGFKAICPFHDDTKPSLSIVPDKQFYHCFTCGAGGDIFKFLVDYEGIPFGEALKTLAHEAGVELKQGNKKNRDRLEQLYEVMKSTDQYYRSNITKPEALEYLKKRNIDLEWAKDFGIGFATDSWEGLKSFLMSNGISIKLIKDLGLISESNGKSFDKFRNRILLPFKNEASFVVGYTGRTIEKDDGNSDFTVAKYMNSPETEIYHKSKILFGFDKSKDYIRQEKSVILVEGNLDFISLYYRGVKNVVAISGTAFSDDQAKRIKRLADRAVLMLDSDNAGQKASLKMVAVLLDNEIEVEGISLPQGEDPDSFIQKIGTEEFKEFIESNKMNFLEYQKSIYDNQYPNGLPRDIKIELIKRVHELSNVVENKFISIDLRHSIKRVLGLQENELSEYFNSMDSSVEKQQKKNSPQKIDRSVSISNYKEERAYLGTYAAFLIKAPDKIPLFRDEIVISDLGEDWKAFYTILFDLYSHDDNEHIENDFIGKLASSEDVLPQIKNCFMLSLKDNSLKIFDDIKDLISKRNSPIDNSNPMALLVARAEGEEREDKIKQYNHQIEITFINMITGIRKRRKRRG